MSFSKHWRSNKNAQGKALPVIIPSETQSREFEAKLLLALALAERGVPAFVGSRMAIHNAMHHFPPSIYVAKDFRKPSKRIFGIMRDLGHHIVAWDEEAVLFFNAKEFHERRVHKPTFRMVEALFAWGPENQSYLATAPGYDQAMPIHEFGNPRLDLLRPELHRYYESEVTKLRKRYGDFVLINTNFGKLNHAVSSYVVRPGGTDKSVGGAITPFMEKAWAHRLAIFESFKAIVPFLAAKLPDTAIVIRPHPAENHQTWVDIAAGHTNVHVIHEGTVQPWLLASKALVHNGCTTGIESYLMGRSAIAFMQHEERQFDYALANDVSVKARTMQEVLNLLSTTSKWRLDGATQDEKFERLGQYFSGLRGPLATDNIASQIETYSRQWTARTTTPGQRIAAGLHARGRAALKGILRQVPDHKNGKAYSDQRFPGIVNAKAEAYIARYREALNRFHSVHSTELAPNIFLISRTDSQGDLE